MYGFTTTLTGTGAPGPAGGARHRPAAALKNVVVREEAPQRIVVGFLDPQIMVKPVGQPEMKGVADAAEQRLRRVCESLGGSTTQAT